MSLWAIDAGTTHTSLARWDEGEQAPVMVHMPNVCRLPHPAQTVDVRYSVPSAVYLLPGDDLVTRIGRLPSVRRAWFLGREAYIGRQAREHDGGLKRPQFISGLKRTLLREPGRIVATLGKFNLSASAAFRIFLREILAEAARTCGERPRDLVFSVPVDSFEPYRALLQQAAVSVGASRTRFVDEPVAAAMGYGLRLDQPRTVLVVDFGGGTLDLAVVQLEPSRTQQGRCNILAKEGDHIGGDLIDHWLVEAWYSRLGYRFDEHESDPNQSWWYRIMLEEACRVKEGLFFRASETFFMIPPPELHRIPVSVMRNLRGSLEVQFTRQDLVSLLEERGLYRSLDKLLSSVLCAAMSRGISADMLSDVLMIGGSTLLPQVYSHVEKRFGRERVRAWQPFDAVAFGAASYAAGAFVKSDFVTHDYGIRLWKREGQGTRQDVQVVIKAGTPYPTDGPVWKRLMTPVCSLGEPETVFKLVICELGRASGSHQELIWDAGGQLYVQGGQGEDGLVVVPLNEANPALGMLDPPHSPSERAARLEVAFGINAERWLVATVTDLRTRKMLMDQQPVVRLQ